MRFSPAIAALLLAGCVTTPQGVPAPGLLTETFGPEQGAQVRTLRKPAKMSLRAAGK